MKKIEAVIFPVHLDAVRAALDRRGIPARLTLIEVRYSDGDKSLPAAERAESEKRIKLELLVEDSEVENAVQAVLRHAQPQSAKEGGQIAVLEVNEILRIEPS